MVEVECLLPMKNGYGESPVWSGAEGALYWVDVKAPAIFRLDLPSRDLRTWLLWEDVGSIGLRRSGGLVAAMRSGFHALDLESGNRHLLAEPRPKDSRVRFNDGKCDRAGRFWSGTLDDVGFEPVGRLYSLDEAHVCREHDCGFVLINGIAWSPDDQFMYVADSRRETIFRYNFSLQNGTIANRTPFISTESDIGRVDGATVASDGTYWCAHVRGGQVVQYDPSGEFMRSIPIPVKYPLMCTFGGLDLDVLYVTTSAAMVTPDEAADQPLAGSLFAIHGTGSIGLPEPYYEG